VKRKLPCHDEYFLSNRYIETPWLATEERTQYPGGHGLGPFSYLVELISILADIDDFLRTQPGSYAYEGGPAKWRSQYEDLDNQLTTWYTQTPHYYKTAIGEAQTQPEWYDINLPMIQALKHM
jgi:hypothetical protein